MVCFGNHEPDIPYTKLLHRIDEFNGAWLNSNMPDAFGGAHDSIVPIVEAAPKWANEVMESHPWLDAVIPITHQDMPEDAALAKTGLFPVIIGGHDHDTIHEMHGSCPIVKAGMDAATAAIIDLEWTDGMYMRPNVHVRLVPVTDYDVDDEIASELEAIHRPVRELELANLYEIPSGTQLTSNGVKFGEASMARFVASALRDCLRCDAGVVNSGAVRGKRDYTDVVSYGDLQRECPYPTSIVVTRMPFDVLRDAIRESRRPWWDIPPDASPGEGNSAFQVDDGIDVDVNHVALTIGKRTPDPSELYSVACDVRYLKKNPVLNAYCEQFPERVQPEDAGRPVLPILVEHLVGQIWKRLLDVLQTTAGPAKDLETIFEMVDIDKNGRIDQEELATTLQKYLGTKLSSKIIVEQMVSMVDTNCDGVVSRDEWSVASAKLSDAPLPDRRGSVVHLRTVVLE